MELCHSSTALDLCCFSTGSLNYRLNFQVPLEDKFQVPSSVIAYYVRVPKLNSEFHFQNFYSTLSPQSRFLKGYPKQQKKSKLLKRNPKQKKSKLLERKQKLQKKSKLLKRNPKQQKQQLK